MKASLQQTVKDPTTVPRASGVKPLASRRVSVTQEGIVFAITVAIFVGFSVALPNYLTTGNVLTLLRSVSVLGMLSLGMALVVIGRGIDLTMVATLAVGLCWALLITAKGVPFGLSLLGGAALAVLFGIAIGVIVAFAEIPAVFTTLAMGSVIFGVGNTFLFSSDTFNAPNDLPWLQYLGYGSLLGVPIVIYALAALALLVHAVLHWTRFGRFVYAMGDNPLTARLTGIPVRTIIICQYVATALIAYLSGIVVVASNSGINSRIYNSTLIYDVLLVVVLGGVGLSGGRGGVRNVLVGTLLVGTLVSGMTIMNLPYATQNLIKSLVLLSALVADTFINPRDEQTSQQGDI